MSVVTLSGSNNTSGNTAAQIIAKVRQCLNETSAHFWTDSELLDWVNQGVLAIAAQALCLGASKAVTLVAGQLEYDISDVAHIAVAAAIYDGRRGLLRGDPRSIGHAGAIKEPTHFFEWDGRLGVYPAPTSEADGAGRVVTAYLVKMPTPLASTDAIPLPAHFEPALEAYVAAKAWMKDKKPELAQPLLGIYENTVNRYRLDLQERGKDEAKEARAR